MTIRLLRLGLLCLLCVACGKPSLSGLVVDPFGVGLANATVGIENTNLSASTDDRGAYKIDYLPGAFRLQVKKPGYTSSAVAYNLSQPADVPAANIVLYPIPKSQGIFYLGKTGLVELPRAGQSIRTVREAYGSRYRYYFPLAAGVPELPAGPAVFIDTSSDQLQLATALDVDGKFFEVVFPTMITMTRLASGFARVTTKQVGEEKLVIHEASLHTGPYAWIEMTEQAFVLPGKHYCPFLVEQSVHN
jgi:hypothetical protein